MTKSDMAEKIKYVIAINLLVCSIMKLSIPQYSGIFATKRCNENVLNRNLLLEVYEDVTLLILLS